MTEVFILGSSNKYAVYLFNGEVLKEDILSRVLKTQRPYDSVAYFTRELPDESFSPVPCDGFEEPPIIGERNECYITLLNSESINDVVCLDGNIETSIPEFIGIYSDIM